MFFSASLAWLYWDPSREAFTIPILDIPIMKYGVMFAVGFIIGYLLVLPMIKRQISQAKTLYARDISNWIMLANFFKNPVNDSYDGLAAQIIKKLDKNELKAIDQLPANTEPSLDLKQSMLVALNGTLNDLSQGDVAQKINRQQLEDLLPHAIVKSKTLSLMFADRLVWFIVLGTIIGARLGHVFFYDWAYYQANPIEILMLRKGGLASHGGTVGVLIALYLFLRYNWKQFPEFTFISLIDILVVPTAITVFFIRIGNFYNQEIVGTESTLPWAIVFGHPAEGLGGIPRHATQLYEAIAYLMTFIILYVLWYKKGAKLKAGMLSGLFFLLVFGSRFFIEFLKLPQGSTIDESYLQTGQYLSIPFILLGIGLMMLPKRYYRPSFRN